ncbi:MAG TPA: ABC transporter ATP-binding protein [Chloroflexota bacterium]|nr:ABC transporter ATP-binding protein [Chloroflexota bacterium]
MSTPIITVRQVSRKFARPRAAPVLALNGVSFTVEAGEFVSLVGPSGCGKTTLLRMLAGLDTPTSGELRVGDAGPGSLLGVCAYMPQHDLLMPWRTVLDNATVALEIAGVPRAEARRRARELFVIFGLTGFEQASPAELSGGMRQRVSLLRTVLTGKRLLLLDEPFGALDAITRADLHAWLSTLLERLAATILLVTHDLDEAAYLSDRVYVMSPRPGRIAAAVPVSLAHPRPYEVTTTAAFTAVKRSLLEALRAARHQEEPAYMGGSA